jgi:tetratricopeptide (TPR) repeat protein
VLRNRHAFDPGDGSVFQLAALIYWGRGRRDLAMMSYYRAYRADPGRRTYLLLPSMFLQLGERELAATWLEEVKRKTEVADYGVEAIMTFLMGDAEEAVRIISADYEQWQAHWILVFTGDLERVRPLYEQGFAKMGRDISQFDAALFWPFYISYAFVLQRTGDPEKAEGLIRDIQSVVDSQYDQGVKTLILNDFHLQGISARLHAMKGETEETLEALRRAVEDGFACWPCIRFDRGFDAVRNDPDIEAFLSDAQSRDAERTARQLRRLREEGLLLTPEEVLALEDFDFDPFAETGSE